MEKAAGEHQEAAAKTGACYKRTVGTEATFLESAKDHFQQFKETPADKHWICLRSKVRAAGEYVSLRTQQGISMFGMQKVDSMVKDGAKDAAKPEAVESH